MVNKKNIKRFDVIVISTVFLSIISQLPIFVQAEMTRVLSIPFWGLMLLYAIFSMNGRVIIEGILLPLGLSAFFLLFWLIMSVFNAEFSKSAIPYTVALAAFIMFTGNQLGPHMDKALLRKVFWSYIIASAILGAMVYLNYFRGQTLDSRVYLYDEKNSTSLILLTSVILLIFMSPGKLKFWRVIRVSMIILMSALIILMRCRAVYISLAILFIIVIINKKEDRKIKIFLILLIISALLYLLINERQLEGFLDTFIYAGRDSSDLNDISSGRVEEWKYFFDDLGDGWLLGNGRMKRETLVLTALLEYGLPVGMLVISLAVFPVIPGIRFLKVKTTGAYLFFIIAVCYVVNMFFEQLAPFGPGVKCFMLWFLLGMISSNPSLIYADERKTESE